MILPKLKAYLTHQGAFVKRNQSPVRGKREKALDRPKASL
jgi:hypothetical protein